MIVLTHCIGAYIIQHKRSSGHICRSLERTQGHIFRLLNMERREYPLVDIQIEDSLYPSVCPIDTGFELYPQGPGLEISHSRV